MHHRNQRSKRGHARNVLSHSARVVALLCIALIAIGAGQERDSKIQGFPDGYVMPEATTTVPKDAVVDPSMTAADPFAVDPDESHSRIADEVVWKDGEIIALPRDPDKRRAAREQARASTAAKKTQTPAATYTPVEVPAVQPIIRQKWDDPHPQGSARKEPTEWDRNNLNISIPDDFEIPADVMRQITEQSGRIDQATEQQMEATIAQSLIQSYAGIDQSVSGLTPPDCDLASSASHVVLVVNSDYAVYDYCGNLLASGDLSNLTSLSVFMFDPKVIYDEWDDRWIIVFVARNTPTQEAWIVGVFSQTSTPPGLGAYWTYNYSWTNNGGWWGDYPDLGVDPDAIYVTTNDFNWSSPAAFQRARIAAFDKLEVYAGLGSGRDEFYAMTNPGDGTLAFALRAAEMKSDPGEQYFVSSKSGGASFLSWFELLGTPTTSWTLNSYNIPCGLYDNPPSMLQGDGTYAACGDARLLTAKYYVSRLWTTHGQRIDYAGGAGDESAIEVYIIDTVNRTIAQETGGWGGGADFFYCYPAVDFDTAGRGVVCFMRGGVTTFPEARYTDLTEGGAFSGSSILVAGTDWKWDSSNAGTAGDPYRLGDYNGCDLNRDGDNSTLWFHGHRAVAPSGQWATHVGAVNYNGAGFLDVAPTTQPLESAGLVGGPFVPSGHTYTLTNTGGARLQWDLTSLNAWNTPTLSGGYINPGGAVNVTVNINATANGYPPGTYLDNYYLNNCMSGAANLRATRLTIGTVGDCEGSNVVLDPGVPFDYVANNITNQDRGAFVTALQDFRICAIGVEMEVPLPQTLTARIYEANGLTRGALLASATHTVVQTGKITHYVPISFTLQECQEYDIAIEFANSTEWDWWDDGPITPFDIGGVIRVRDGESAGGAGNFALMKFSIIGEATDSPLQANLEPGVPYTNNGADPFGGQRGIYVSAERTFHLNRLGWLTDVPAGQELTALIYESTGLTRGALLATGTIVSTSAGVKWYDIPVNAVLEEGKEYDLSIAHGAINPWDWWNEGTLTQPYTVGDVRVIDGNYTGGAANFVLPHFRVNYGEYVSGFPLDLAKPSVAPFSVSQDNSQYGALVRSLLRQEAYSLGWYADVPEGEPIIARVYDATGNTIGGLLSEGTILSSGPGTRWHDVPVSASLNIGGEYAIDIEWQNVTTWYYWSDTSGLPYNAQNRIEVYEGQSQSHPGGGGIPANNTALNHMRLFSCEETATGIGDQPIAPPAFALHMPYPNPARTHTMLGYNLDHEGPVTMTVYNVAGQRVKTLMSEQRPVGPGQLQFDTTGLAAGVYFVKMQTNTKSVTRKITIVR